MENNSREETAAPNVSAPDPAASMPNQQQMAKQQHDMMLQQQIQQMAPQNY